MHLPIREYVDLHGLRPAADVLLPLFTGYGYGYAEEIPAAYLFKLAFLGTPRSAAGFWHWLRLKARLSSLRHGRSALPKARKGMGRNRPRRIFEAREGEGGLRDRPSGEVLGRHQG